ncbi:MAG: hypothetical protein HZB76_02280 [Chlamydiae bacterium]|nr:hypothetical protein [Chlamydiota bacterium]
MMFYSFHSVSMSLMLITLILAAGLLIFARMHEKAAKLSKIIAYFVIIFAFLGIVCSTYSSIRYYNNCKGGTCRCPMMQGQMMDFRLRQSLGI